MKLDQYSIRSVRGQVTAASVAPHSTQCTGLNGTWPNPVRVIGLLEANTFVLRGGRQRMDGALGTMPEEQENKLSQPHNRRTPRTNTHILLGTQSIAGIGHAHVYTF